MRGTIDHSLAARCPPGVSPTGSSDLRCALSRPAVAQPATRQCNDRREGVEAAARHLRVGRDRVEEGGTQEGGDLPAAGHTDTKTGIESVGGDYIPGGATNTVLL